MQETWETSPRETPRLGKIFWRRAENPVQYSCLKNPMDRGAWYIRVHRATQVGYDWSNLVHFYQRHQRSSVQFSLSLMFDCLWTHGLQHARRLCPSPTSWSLFNSNSNACPSSQWCHPTISSSVVPSPPACNLFQHQGHQGKWVSSSCQVANVLKFQFQHQSFQWINRTDFL